MALTDRRSYAKWLYVATLGATLTLVGCTHPQASDTQTQAEQAVSADAATDGTTSETTDDTTVPQEEPPAHEAVSPHELAAETELSEEDIARAGGTEAFFEVEQIPDAVFARMEGRSFSEGCGIAREDLRYVRVLHVDADGRTLTGELVVGARVADEVKEIFRQLYELRYPIRRMHLVDDYGADDFTSCMDDNTSAFNWRLIQGTTQLSNHARGLAIDINPFENPYYIVSSGYLCPPERWDLLDRDQDLPYLIKRGDPCQSLFASYGWTWGGDWADPIDYQHFEKPYA